MKPIYLILTIFFFSIAVNADESIDEIYRDFSEGKIKEAGEKLLRLPQTTVRDGNRLFVTALLEQEGQSVKSKLEAALRSDLDGKYYEEAYFRIIQLAVSSGDTNKVISAGNSFLDLWETSQYRDNILAILSAHDRKNKNKKERYLNLLADEFGDSYYGRYARLAKANDALYNGHFKAAEKYCRQIINAANDDLTPASLILLSKISLKNGNSERALFNYNILREQYRHAIGQEELLDALRGVSESRTGDESTEVFEGITYSVKVGVYAEKNNAKNMSKRIEGYGYKSERKRKNISGKNYYVVYAGKFTTLKDAQIAKQKLEIGENELFKIVTNDEK